MKCLSRSTLGVVIGSLNLGAYVIIFIGIIGSLLRVNTVAREESEKPGARSLDPYGIWDDKYELNNYTKVHAYMALSNTVLVIILIICVAMGIISGLLIMGIVKRRHSLMAPWLILTAIGLASSCLRLVVAIFDAFTSGHQIGVVFLALLFACLILGLQALILYHIYTLYKDIRDENNVRPGHIATAPQVGFTNAYTAPPTYYYPVHDKAPPTYYYPVHDKAPPASYSPFPEKA